MASFPVSEMNLISLLPWNKDFVPRGWKDALAEEAVTRSCCCQALTLKFRFLSVQFTLAGSEMSVMGLVMGMVAPVVRWTRQIPNVFRFL